MRRLLFFSCAFLLLCAGCQINGEDNQRDGLLHMNNPVKQPPQESKEESENRSETLPIPNEQADNGAEEIAPPLEESANEQAQTLLLNEFTTRWNAISNDITGENMISDLQPSATTKNYYAATIANQLEIRLFPTADKILKIQIVGASTIGQEEIYKMLSSWWQLLIITNPALEEQDVDLLFNTLGVKANANIENLQPSFFHFNGVKYTLTITDTEYIFEALYEER